MKKMLLCPPSGLRTFTTSWLALVLALASCASTRETEPIGGAPDWGPWKVLERSGKEPNWKDNFSQGIFWGEGMASTEQEALENAEADMRSKAARYLKTDIKEIHIIRRTTTSENSQSETRAGTDVSVRGMSVGESYRELRERTGRQYGTTFTHREWRVLVQGALTRGS